MTSGAEALSQQRAKTLVNPSTATGVCACALSKQPRQLCIGVFPWRPMPTPTVSSFHVLIHVIEGALNELEVYREDSGDVLVAHAAAKQLEVEPVSMTR